MNHFFAIELSPDARQSVTATVEEWKTLLTLAQSAKWYGPDDYHITLNFLGDLPASNHGSLIASASPVAASAEPFELALAGGGAFSTLWRPNLLWVGVQECSSLMVLTAHLEDALASVGYPREQRSYKPHITVARCKPARISVKWPVPSERLFPSWQVTRFVLMQTPPPESRANGTESRYNTVHTFPLGGAHSSDVS